MTKAKQTKPSGLDAELNEAKREWKNLKRFKRQNHLIYSAFIIAVTLLVVANTIYIITHNKSQPKQTDSVNQSITADNTVLTSLQTANNNFVRVRIGNVGENSRTDYAFPIDQSETMLILDISIKNLTNSTQQLYPVNQLYVRSREGDYRALHASMYVTKPLAAQDVKAGQTVEGQISFNVPKRLSSPLLYVDTGWNDSTPVVFDVLH